MMYHHGLGEGLLAEQAAQTAHREYVVLTDFGTFSKVPCSLAQFLEYPDTLPQLSSGEFLELARLAFQGKTSCERRRIECCEITSSTRETSSGVEAAETLKKLVTLRRES